MGEEEKEAIEYFKKKIKNKLPLYEETYIDGKPYRRNILQLETNFTEEQANKASVILNLIEKQRKEIKNMAIKQNDLIDEYENELLQKNNYIFQLENEREALHKVIDEEMG